VRAGMERLFERRRRLLEEGAEPLGWKLALGPPAAREPLGLAGPVVGFLTGATELASGASCAVGAWTAPRLEPEIAIFVGASVPPGAGPEQAATAVAGLGAAIELADVDRPPAELEDVVAGNIYHRRVVLPADPPAPGLPTGPIAVDVRRDGEPLAATPDAEATVGSLADLVAYVARYLAEFGAELRSGELIITGSTVPLIEIRPGERVRSEVAGANAVEVSLA
jgi:2-keto-4-pentenoate hydratase